MIVTNKSNEFSAHSKIMGGDAQVWRNIHLENEAPYFMVIYSVREEITRIRQTSILWQESDLVSLCDQINAAPEFGLIRVCLLSPPWMNRSKLWQIDRLEEIRSAVHCRTGRGICYVLSDKRYLFNSIYDFELREWTTADTLFSIDRYTVISDFDSPQCIEVL